MGVATALYLWWVARRYAYVGSDHRQFSYTLLAFMPLFLVPVLGEIVAVGIAAISITRWWEWLAHKFYTRYVVKPTNDSQSRHSGW